MSEQHNVQCNEKKLNQAKKGKSNHIDLLVSKNLRVKRIILGISQERVAQEIGVTIQQIAKYEQCTNRISSGNLYHIAKLFKVPVTYFYHPNNDDDESLVYIKNEYEKETIVFMKVFNNIKDVQCRKRLIELAKAVEQVTQ